MDTNKGFLRCVEKAFVVNFSVSALSVLSPPQSGYSPRFAGKAILGLSPGFAVLSPLRGESFLLCMAFGIEFQDVVVVRDV